MVGFGILGAGRVIQNRLADVFLNEVTNCKVVAVCDLIEERAYNVARQFKAEPSVNEQMLFQNNNVDVIFIATESGNHYDHAKKALSAGKHVVVEKPPTMTPEQLLEIGEFANHKGLMYAPVFQNRLNPAVRILKEHYSMGRFGKIVLATVRLRWCRYQDYYDDGWHGTWKMDGGVINQQAIHHIDALQWVCGSVENVFAMQTNALNSLEAEDTTVASVKFENGALGAIEATTAARPEDFEASLSIVGEKGMVVIGGIALNNIEKWTFVDAIDEDKIIPSNYSQDVPTGYGLSHGPLLQIIIDRLEGKRIDPPITAKDCLPTLKLVHALYHSNETGKVIRLKDNLISKRLGI